MDEIQKINSVKEYNDLMGLPTYNPLITAVDYTRVEPSRSLPANKNYGIYGIFLKGSCGEFQYGLNKYDFNEGTLVFVGPGQITGACTSAQPFPAAQPVKVCMGILFSPDLVAASGFARRMRDYSFFSYDSNEALHMTSEERESVMIFFREIEREIQVPPDRHSVAVVSSTLEALLNRCLRFYDRQFSSRNSFNRDVLSRLERLIDDCYSSGEAESKGVPTVGWCAEQLCFSPNYFGDLVKKCTGSTAQDYIHSKVVEQVKRLIGATDLTFSEIAYKLGYRYPHHMSRMFKHVTGLTPNEYRAGIRQNPD